MKTLYIIKAEPDSLVAGLLEGLTGNDSILVMHDAVLLKLKSDCVIYACEEDVRARCVKRGYKSLNYHEIAELIRSNDRVIML